MDFEMTGRGTTITARQRAQAEAGLQRIEKVIGPKATAKIVLTCVKTRCEAEVTIHSPLHEFSARTEALNGLEAALKDAIDKVEVQAVKAKKKMVVGRHHPVAGAAGSVRMQTDDGGTQALSA